MVQHFHHSIMWIATLLLKCRFTSIETIGLLGTEAHDVHVDVHIFHLDVQFLMYSYISIFIKNVMVLRKEKITVAINPLTPSTFHQFENSGISAHNLQQKHTEASKYNGYMLVQQHLTFVVLTPYHNHISVFSHDHTPIPYVLGSFASRFSSA